MQKLVPAVILALSAAALPAFAAEPTTTAAATTPASRPRRALVIPPGFERVSASGITILCEPADKPWIADLLQHHQPATRPTTMPSDLLANLRSSLPAVLEQMKQDLALQDITPVQQRLEEQLIPRLETLNAFHAPVFYLVSTKARIQDLVKSGQWEDPAFHYNRAADDLVIRETISLTTEGQMDDAILPLLYDPADDREQVREKLSRVLRESQHMLRRMIAGRAMFEVQMSLADSMMQDLFAPMKLPEGQRWLVAGLAGTLSADYAATLTGSPRKELLLLIAAELRQNPIKPGTINLLAPTDPSALRPQFVAAYNDAYRRKSVAVTAKLVERARESLPKLMTSLRETPCASPQDLIARIKQITGVDLAADAGTKK